MWDGQLANGSHGEGQAATYCRVLLVARLIKLQMFRPRPTWEECNSADSKVLGEDGGVGRLFVSTSVVAEMVCEISTPIEQLVECLGCRGAQ
jgi:hypothetical protein